MLDLLGFGLVIPFLPKEVRDNFHTTAFVSTLVGSSYSLMQFLFVPVWGALSDRIGRRPVLVWSVAASAITMTALGLALAFQPGLGWIFAARLASGIATANLGTASAYIADITTPKDRARGMGLIGMAFGLGFILGPVVGGILAKRVPINGHPGPMPCFVAAGLGVINFVWVLFGVPESLPSKRADAPPMAIAPPVNRRSFLPLNGETLKRAFSYPGVPRAVCVYFLVILSFTNLEQTFAFFTFDEFKVDEEATGYVLFFSGVVAASVQGGLMRRLTKRFVESSLIRAGVALQAMAFLLYALSPDFGYIFLFFPAAVLAVGNGVTQPTVSAFVSKAAPASDQGTALSTNQSAGSLARAVGPLFAGYVYQTFGHRAPFLAAAGGMGVALLLAMGLRSPAPADEAGKMPA